MINDWKIKINDLFEKSAEVDLAAALLDFSMEKTIEAKVQ